MGKKKTKTKKSSASKQKDEVDDQITNTSQSVLQEIEAISDEEEGTNKPVFLEENDGSESDEDEKSEWNAEAEALRNAIAEGAFNDIGTVTPVAPFSNDEKDEEDEEDTEELVNTAPPKRRENNVKAMTAKVNEIQHLKSNMPWSESFSVTSPTPLPFHDKDNALDIHDDLKREVAFYNTALASLQIARAQCTAERIPFTRPLDFFAEMVKTDSHMTKIKDRLIFETKKMEAFEQRKNNKEFKLRAKEAASNRIAEKSRTKQNHFKAVDDWKDDAKEARGKGGVDDGEYLDNLDRTKKRARADQKFGFGGSHKRGHFKIQGDRKSLNDMSGYNPKGNFDGGGTKGQKRGGNKRQGKRARDAQKSRG
eukprot:CAMPEP_0194358518 /NCGR_PEP_ID=MMETSP0174-20130528/5693_1 /TAXON_ID=216777 /ORGANISM="Proboscia alata, Strain PI-D3" /LENGTH=365 /DNA_ID=CAMNT_0039128849 /DNA_START=51 /DNA_END=1148 /DNA_ORIENTATION=-